MNKPCQRPAQKRSSKKAGDAAEGVVSNKDRPQRTAVSLEVLRTLLAYCDEGGVSAAARRLSVSQPVVSRKLDALTKTQTCGAILLRRKNGTLQLTEAGLATLPTIRQLVRDYHHLVAYWNGQSSAPQAISLAVGHFAAAHYVSKAVAAFQAERPDCEVTTQVLRGSDRILETYDGRVDLAVVSHDRTQIAEFLRRERGKNARLKMTKLASPPLVVIARTDSPEGRQLSELSPRRGVPLAKLVGFELVGLDILSGVRRQLETRLMDLQPNSRLTFVAEGGGWSAAREFARCGLGVAIVPKLVVRKDDEQDFAIRRLSAEFQFAETCIYRPEVSDKAQQLIQSLHGAAKAAMRNA